MTQGGMSRNWRVLAIDGFEVDLPDTEADAAEFGCAGSADNWPPRSPRTRCSLSPGCARRPFVKVGRQTVRLGAVIEARACCSASAGRRGRVKPRRDRRRQSTGASNFFFLFLKSGLFTSCHARSRISSRTSAGTRVFTMLAR